MRKEEINIYKFLELSDEAKNKARDWYRNASSGDQWWESVYDDAKAIGCKITQFDIDRGNYCKLNFVHSASHVAQTILKEVGKS